jgi:nucleotide-binding universal stress UspA family protein
MQPILTATDLTDTSTAATERAAEIASEEVAAMHLLHVLPRGASAQRSAEARAKLDALAESLRQRFACIAAVEAEVASGSVARMIAATADRIDARLIVLGHDGAIDWGMILAGSTSERLVRRTGRPVLIARNTVDHPYRTALVAVDASAMARRALDLAFTIGSLQRLYVLHAYQPRLLSVFDELGEDDSHVNAARVRLDHLVAEACARHRNHKVETTARVAEGDPVTAIEATWDVLDPDLVVIVTRPGLSVLLGLRDSVGELAIEGERFDLLIQRAR